MDLFVFSLVGFYIADIAYYFRYPTHLLLTTEILNLMAGLDRDMIIWFNGCDVTPGQI